MAARRASRMAIYLRDVRLVLFIYSLFLVPFLAHLKKIAVGKMAAPPKVEIMSLIKIFLRSCFR